MSENAVFLDNNTIDSLGFGKVLNAMTGAGVADITTGWAVTQRGAGANQSFDIAVGSGFLSDILGYKTFAYSTAVYNLAAPAADATNPRKDIVIAYIDKSVTGTTNGLGALKFKVVSGSAAGSPVDPDSTALQSGAGAGNPYLQLSRRTTPASNNTVSNAQLTDLRVSSTLSLLIPDLSITTAKLNNASVTAAKMGAVTVASLGSTAWTNGIISSLTNTFRSGSAANGVCQTNMIVNIAGLSIPDNAVVLEYHFWLNPADNSGSVGTSPAQVYGISRGVGTHVISVVGQWASNSSTAPNNANSGIQGFVRYIA